jgi:hypothetical protein
VAPRGPRESPGKGPEEFENFDPSRDDEDEASPSRRQRRDEGHRQHGLRQPPEGLSHGATKDATGAERDGPDTHMAGPDDAAERDGQGDPAPTAPERGASEDYTAETTKEAEQRAMFAASRAVAEGDLQAAYRIACGAPRPMAVARHILELLKKLHPTPGSLASVILTLRL